MNSLLLDKYVKFPADRRSQMRMKEEFLEYCSLNGVIGAIDCTHIAIIAPSDDDFHNEKNYVNRKNFHSINVQLVCDMNQNILNVVARFPRCSRDTFIWKNSNLKIAFKQGLIAGNGCLLGYSEYPEEFHLKTPIEGAADNFPETQYNLAHARGRNVIERCNGTLKSRFRCLLRHRTLNYDPDTAGKIINSCVILHNICNNESFNFEEYNLTDDDLPFNTGSGADYV